jgi:hypothetical protein
MGHHENSPVVIASPAEAGEVGHYENSPVEVGHHRN